MAIAAPQFVGALLGARWVAADPLIAWIAGASALIMTASLFANVLEVALHLNSKFYGQLASLFGGIILFALLTPRGVVYASAALTGAWALYFVGQVALSKILLHLNGRKLLASFTPGLVTGLVIVLYVAAVREFLHLRSPVVMFIVEVAGCGILQCGVIVALFPRLFQDLMVYAGLRYFTGQRIVSRKI